MDMIHLSLTPSSSQAPSSPAPLSLSPVASSCSISRTSGPYGTLRCQNAKTRASSLSPCSTRSMESPILTKSAGEVLEVCNDTFWPIVNSAGNKTIVLDMYTQWCGPCKLMAPKFQKLSEKYEDVIFLKLDCNKQNKPLAVELGLKVVPTFKIIKGGMVVKELTGAKFNELDSAIDSVNSI